MTQMLHLEGLNLLQVAFKAWADSSLAACQREWLVAQLQERRRRAHLKLLVYAVWARCTSHARLAKLRKRLEVHESERARERESKRARQRERESETLAQAVRVLPPFVLFWPPPCFPYPPPSPPSPRPSPAFGVSQGLMNSSPRDSPWAFHPVPTCTFTPQGWLKRILSVRGLSCLLRARFVCSCVWLKSLF